MKIIVTESQIKKILSEENKQEKLIQKIFNFLDDNFEVFGDVNFYNLTSSKLIVFKYDDEYFRYYNNKKYLKNKIVSYIKYDDIVQDMLSDIDSEQMKMTILNSAVKNFIDKYID